VWSLTYFLSFPGGLNRFAIVVACFLAVVSRVAAVSFVSCNEFSTSGLQSLNINGECGFVCTTGDAHQTTIPNTIDDITFTVAGVGNNCTFTFVFFDADLTGSIPVDVGSLNFNHSIFMPNNTLSGSIPSTVKSNSNLIALNLDYNDITSTSASDFISDFTSNIESIQVFGNPLSGDYDDPALFTYIAQQASSLRVFSVEFPTGSGCMDTTAINNFRVTQNGWEEVAFTLPEDAICFAPIAVPSSQPTETTTFLPTRSPVTLTPTIDIGGQTSSPTDPPTPFPTTFTPTVRPPPTARPLPPRPGAAQDETASRSMFLLFALVFSVLVLHRN